MIVGKIIYRVLMFATLKNFDYLSESECLICDGTFKMVPHNFYQLYVFLGKVVETYVHWFMFCCQTRQNMFTN
jgi:hypothetical protein